MSDVEGPVEERWMSPTARAHVLHDLKTPFNGIIGLTDALICSADQEEERHYLQTINRCAVRLAKWMEAIFSCDSIFQGVMPWKLEAVPVRQLLLETCDVMRHAVYRDGQLVKADQVLLEVDYPPSWSKGGPSIRCDVARVSKAFYHMVHNALLFTSAGKVTVTATEVEGDVVVTVIDTGCGMDVRDTQRVLRPFVRAAPQTALPSRAEDEEDESPRAARRAAAEATAQRGLGLGLAVVHETALLHGGSVSVTSERSTGTTVALRLPVAPQQRAADRGPEGFGCYVDLSKPLGPGIRLEKRTVGLLAYEMRVPLMGITGLAAWLTQREVEKSGSKQLDMLSRCAIRLIALLEVVCDAALTKERGAGMVVTSVNVCALIGQVFSTLNRARNSLNQLIKRKEVAFLNTVPASLPTVEADAARLYKLFYHLVENALKFTIRGHVRIDGRASPTGVTMVVEDSGSGVADDKYETIFNAFVSMEATGHRGLGLGLTIVRDVVELHGGEVKVQSAPGKGSNFSVFLPFKRTDVASPAIRSTDNGTLAMLQERLRRCARRAADARLAKQEADQRVGELTEELPKARHARGLAAAAAKRLERQTEGAKAKVDTRRAALAELRSELERTPRSVAHLVEPVSVSHQSTVAAQVVGLERRLEQRKRRRERVMQLRARLRDLEQDLASAPETASAVGGLDDSQASASESGRASAAASAVVNPGMFASVDAQSSASAAWRDPGRFSSVASCPATSRRHTVIPAVAYASAVPWVGRPRSSHRLVSAGVRLGLLPQEMDPARFGSASAAMFSSSLPWSPQGSVSAARFSSALSWFSEDSEELCRLQDQKAQLQAQLAAVRRRAAGISEASDDDDEHSREAVELEASIHAAETRAQVLGDQSQQMDRVIEALQSKLGQNGACGKTLQEIRQVEAQLRSQLVSLKTTITQLQADLHILDSQIDDLKAGNLSVRGKVVASRAAVQSSVLPFAPPDRRIERSGWDLGGPSGGVGWRGDNVVPIRRHGDERPEFSSCLGHELRGGHKIEKVPGGVSAGAVWGGSDGPSEGCIESRSAVLRPSRSESDANLGASTSVTSGDGVEDIGAVACDEDSEQRNGHSNLVLSDDGG
mmetsp:Transcript_37273/g.83504  ORF Transcript_37273/g.83504 Transcript_37273/m.83504 type:complete len:1110 (+) Transcript_37273:34-3363(+)